jgi:hypothetical protein
MNRREQIDLEAKLSVLASEAEEVAAMLHTSNPSTASKFRKIGSYARNIATCVRLHGQVPQEKAPPPVVALASKVHKLTQLFPDAVSSLQPPSRRR